MSGTHTEGHADAGAPRRRRAARLATLAEAVAALLVGAAAVRVLAGPLRFDVLGATLSVRSLSRPLVAAAIIVALRAWLDAGPGRAARWLAMAGRILLLAVLCAGVLGWATFLSTTCGGADSYGYVSAAERLLDRALIVREPLAPLLPFPDAISAATPLGYTPSGRVEGASVPAYPLGLPALMAIVSMAAGTMGPFMVAPLFGLLLLASVYATAHAITNDRAQALTAAALTAVHPVVFTYSIQPMSDVPAAAFFITAIAALAGRIPRPILGGICAAVCVLIRPALAPALFALAAVPSLRARGLDVRSGLSFTVPLAAGVGVQLATQWYLYGHPLASGYEGMGTLFSLERVAVNVRSHGYWAWRALGPLFLATAAIGLALASSAARRVTLLVAIAVALPYLAYRTYDHWETLRFLLPALVMLNIPAASALLAIGRRVAGAHGGVLVAAVVTVAMAQGWVSWMRDATVFLMPDHETRYRLAGELVTQTTPPNAVVLAQLHSGSVRYYAHRQTVNWDRIPDGALPATIEALQLAGHPVYVLVDSAEERTAFERRHGTMTEWLPGGQRRSVQLFEAPGRRSAFGVPPP